VKWIQVAQGSSFQSCTSSKFSWAIYSLLKESTVPRS